MKRDPALVPLTHDHHHALAQARRLRLAAGKPGAELGEAVRGFLAFYDAELIRHFREEEEELFPLLIEATGSAPDPLVRVLVEHLELHGRVRRLRQDLDGSSPPPDELLELSKLLEGHIHLEERVLFPLIEKEVSQRALGEVALAPRQRGP